jgi:hypothetical protein
VPQLANPMSAKPKSDAYDMWIGVHGAYRVPAAISNLGRAANQRRGLPTSCIGWREFKQWEESPYYKIVEEWGKWRDNQP